MIRRSTILRLEQQLRSLPCGRDKVCKQNSLEDGLRRRAADEKAAFEAEHERMHVDMRAATDKMEAENNE